MVWNNKGHRVILEGSTTSPTRRDEITKDRVDVIELPRKRGVDGDLDFSREALRVLADGIKDAEVSALTGAEYGERIPDRITHRNGHRGH